MATEANKLQVGIFVIVVSILAVAAVIWLGASRFFEDTQRVATYFGESVQGLEPGSAVKYRGVPAGRVQAIRIAPDGELIEVILDIDVDSAKALKHDLSLRATLELSGITGLRYIEIDRRSGEALMQSPTLSFHTDYEVIPSARSSFKAIQSALADVYDKVMQLDFAGISNDARTTLQAANTILRDPRINTLLTNVNEISQSATQLAKNIESITRDVKLGPIVANLTQASADARDLLTELNTGATGQKLEQAIDQFNRLSMSAHEVVTAAQLSLDRLDRAASSLQNLTEDVQTQPSLLLFSEPPAPRREPGGAP